jgi:hypothetical protein
MLVVDNKQGDSAFSYVRNNGAYWNGLQNNGKSAGLKTVPDHFPKVCKVQCILGQSGKTLEIGMTKGYLCCLP